MIYLEQITASSVKLDDTELFGPQYANDGLLSTYDKHLFISTQEDYPWIQWQLPTRIRITGVSIANRNDCCGYHLKNVEVRAGIIGVNSTFKGNITVNDVCGTFEGPGRHRQEYKVNCNSTLLASYITVQIMDQSAILQINELKYTTESRALFGNNKQCLQFFKFHSRSIYFNIFLYQIQYIFSISDGVIHLHY